MRIEEVPSKRRRRRKEVKIGVRDGEEAPIGVIISNNGDGETEYLLVYKGPTFNVLIIRRRAAENDIWLRNDVYKSPGGKPIQGWTNRCYSSSSDSIEIPFNSSLGKYLTEVYNKAWGGQE